MPVPDDGKRFFEAVESWTTGGGGAGGGGWLVGLICRISRQKKTAKAAFVCKNLRFTMLLQGAFCVERAFF